MAPPARSVPAAFLRGLSQVVANPGLILAPLAFGFATFALVAGATFGCFLAAGGALAHGFGSLRRGPAGVSDFLEELWGTVLSSPGIVLLLLLVLLVLLLLLTALAAWVRAGVTGALAEADARAGPDAPVSAYRLPSPGAAFFGWAGRKFSSFFGLVNLYGLVASFVVALLVVPLVLAVVGAFDRSTSLLGVSGVAFFIAFPIVVVGGVAMRIVYLAAGRVLVAEPELDALAAVGRAAELARRDLGRSVGLYFLCVAAGILVGAAFVVPRMILTFVAGSASPGFGTFALITGVFLVLQIAAGMAFELVITGAFVALWPAEASGAAVPVAEIPPEPLVP